MVLLKENEQIFDARSRTILTNGPDPTIPIAQLSFEKKAWIDVNNMHAALGLVGQSSDESVAGESSYYVRKMDWRSPDVVKCYELVKKAQSTGFNMYGKRSPGTKPRDRKRRQGASLTSRTAPAGLPSNLYDGDWYQSLTYWQQ